MEVELGKPFELECNALTLGTLYPHSRISWYFNEALFQSFNNTPAVLVNEFFLFPQQNSQLILLAEEYAEIRACRKQHDWRLGMYDIRDPS